MEDKKKETRLVPCMIYSRVVGYFRPVSDWNIGKRAEFADRQEMNYKKFVAQEITQYEIEK